MRDELLNETLFFDLDSSISRRPRQDRSLGRRLRHSAASLVAQIPHPLGVRRPSHRNRRSVTGPADRRLLHPDNPKIKLRGGSLLPLPATHPRMLHERCACRNRFHFCRARHPAAITVGRSHCSQDPLAAAGPGQLSPAFADRKNAGSRRSVARTLKVGRPPRETGTCRATSSRIKGVSFTVQLIGGVSRVAEIP